MSLKSILQANNPFGRLTVACHYPKDETLVFYRKSGGLFGLKNQPEQGLRLMEITISPAISGLNRVVSDGALVGASVAAMMDRDIMHGALVGHFLEQGRRTHQNQSHHLKLIFLDQDTQEILSYQLSLSEVDCRTVYRYFVN